MAQGSADRGERNTGVATRRLYDSVGWSNSILTICLLQNMKGHSIFDTARHIQMLGLSVNQPFFAIESESDCEQRGITNHVLQLLESTWHRTGSRKQTFVVF